MLGFGASLAFERGIASSSIFAAVGMNKPKAGRDRPFQDHVPKVNRSMVRSTYRHEVIWLMIAAQRLVSDVMDIDERRMATPRKHATTLISLQDQAAHGRWHVLLRSS